MSTLAMLATFAALVAPGQKSLEEARAEAEWAPGDEELATLKENVEEARRLADRFGGVEEIGPPEECAPPGPCYECGGHTRTRWLLGIFLLCRVCRVRRYLADEKLKGEASA